MPCKFCDDYYDIRRINRASAAEARAKERPLRHTYKVSLVVDTHKLFATNSHGSRTTFRPVPLNYCPMCGKRFKKGK